jgi:hypothetical protein
MEREKRVCRGRRRQLYGESVSGNEDGLKEKAGTMLTSNDEKGCEACVGHLAGGAMVTIL